VSFRIKRVYEPATAQDGIRVLVDRLWPRGVRKESARLDSWLKDVAPSPTLRRWFDHRPERFAEFGRRYRQELKTNAAFEELLKLGHRRRVTLVYGARDPAINHAVVLHSALINLGRPRPAGPRPREIRSSQRAPRPLR
jgi:uncharacterized protein YeaO (DUF488 family)